MPIAPRMNQPVGPYDFWRDTLQPGLFGLRAALQQGLLNPLQMAAAPAARYGLLAEGDTKTRQQTLDSIAMSPGLFGDVIGPIADAYRFGTDPESRTWENAGFAALGALPFVPAVGSMVRNANTLPMDEAGRASRMKEMGHERGFWRGGKKAADGPWYARSKEGAAGFDRGDLREYSLKMDNAFSYGKTYTPEDLKEIKSALETRGYDQTAKYLLDIPGDYGGAAPGEAIVQAVKMATGPQAMGPIFKEAGFDVIDMGTELIVTHGQGTVRDAVRAAYDKAKQASPDIFAGLLAPAVGLGAYGFLGPNDDSL